MGEDHTPRPDDHLVEPMYEALREPGPEAGAGPASPPEADPQPTLQPDAGRGCLGLLLLGAVSLGLAAAVPVAWLASLTVV